MVKCQISEFYTILYPTPIIFIASITLPYKHFHGPSKNTYKTYYFIALLAASFYLYNIL